MARILLAEDDMSLASGLSKILKHDGYAVDHFARGNEALEVAGDEPYAAVILDIGLPDMSGLDVVKTMRVRSIKTPVLILTAHQDIETCVNSLDFGADDYITKPFDISEFSARLRALIRRGAGDPSPHIEVGRLKCDLTAGIAYVDDKPLALRKREWSVLVSLTQNAEQVVPRERLSSEVFGYEEPVGTNAIEVYVARLRKKLGEKGPTIRSLRGIGYIISAEP